MSLISVDRVLTRLGAEDSIIGDESAFLVELQEKGAILSHTTPHSLVLMKEFGRGRGTASNDGKAIAGAVMTHLHTEPEPVCHPLSKSDR